MYVYVLAFVILSYVLSSDRFVINIDFVTLCRCAFVTLNSFLPSLTQVPSSVFATLGISEGAQLQFSTFQPEIGTLVKLRTHDPDFMELSEPIRRALMEQVLRTRTMLVVGDVLELSYARRIFALVVEETAPNRCIKILDCDLPVEVLFGPSDMTEAEAPLTSAMSAFGDEPSPERAAQSAPAAAAAAAAGTTYKGGRRAGSMSPPPSRGLGSTASPPPGILGGAPVTGLALAAPLAHALARGESAYYSFKIDSPHVTVCLDVVPTSPGADKTLCVFVRTATEGPYPHAGDATWRILQLTPASNSLRLVLNQADPAFEVARYAVAVTAVAWHGAPAEATYTLGINEIADPGPPSSAPVTVILDPAASVLCDNCKKSVPKASMVMHERQCARNNYYCGACQVVLPMREKDKHIAIAHGVVVCVCGGEFEQTTIFHHKKTLCPQRLLPCRFCPLSIAHVDMFAHQDVCRVRQVMCLHCQAPMRAQGVSRFEFGDIDSLLLLHFLTIF